MEAAMTLSFLDHFRNRTSGPGPAPAPVFDGLAQVRAYWEGMRRNGVLPTRAALDPRGFGNVLDRVFLAERIGPGLVQVRIAGSGLAVLAGTDLRGLPLSCIFAPASRPVLAQVLETVLCTPVVAEVDLASDHERQGQLAARLILLPLAVEGASRQLLGAISFADSRLSPCKLQIMARREEMLTIRPVVPDQTPKLRASHLTLVRNDA